MIVENRQVDDDNVNVRDRKTHGQGVRVYTIFDKRDTVR